MGEGKRGLPQTSLERAGLAIGAGGAASGVGWALLAALNGAGPLGMLTALALGALFTMLGITALAAPVWLALHLAGHRGPGMAALTGAGLTFVLFLFAQTYGLGLGGVPPGDGATAAMRWASAAAVALVLALFGAAIAALMWWVAYRR